MKKKVGHQYTRQQAENWRKIFPKFARARACTQNNSAKPDVILKKEYKICPICGAAVISPTSHLLHRHKMRSSERQSYLYKFETSQKS